MRQYECDNEECRAQISTLKWGKLQARYLSPGKSFRNSLIAEIFYSSVFHGNKKKKDLKMYGENVHTYTHTLATPVCFTPVEKFMYPTDICHLYTRRDNGHNEIPVPVDKAGVDQIISYYPCRAALVTVISKTAETPGWCTTRPLNSAISNPAPRRSAFKSASRRIFERTTVARVTRLCRLMKRYVLFFFFRASATTMFDARAILLRP